MKRGPGMNVVEAVTNFDNCVVVTIAERDEDGNFLRNLDYAIGPIAGNAYKDVYREAQALIGEEVDRLPDILKGARVRLLKDRGSS